MDTISYFAQVLFVLAILSVYSAIASSFLPDLLDGATSFVLAVTIVSIILGVAIASIATISLVEFVMNRFVRKVKR